MAPMLIEHIDAIARQENRDVLFVTFNPKPKDDDDWMDLHYNWERDKMRDQVCDWLTKHNIPWRHCAEVADESCMMSYQGQIYIDVPFDDNNPVYRLVRSYFENPDGTMRYESVIFWVLELNRALLNAHHDEPGFWERWAENF